MLKISDYFGKFEHTEDHENSAVILVDHVNKLLEFYQYTTGNQVHINPSTKTIISGQSYGGFRPQDCPIGASNSAHKQAQAVDIYDLDEKLDRWISDGVLTQFGLYRESPMDTKGWCHLSIRSPKSGKRTFNP